MEKSIYDNDFTEDEVACLKRMVYKFRQNEILELYNAEAWKLYKTYRTTVSGCLPQQDQVSKPKSLTVSETLYDEVGTFLVKAKDAIVNFFRKDPRWY